MKRAYGIFASCRGNREETGMIFEKQIVETFKKTAYKRCDDNGLAYYFTAKDFARLNKTPYPFKSSLGHKLQGYLYNYDSPIDGRLVVFDHGFGGGHESYMKEIEKLCRHGYRVFAYDHTGCMESGGETTRGMAQSLHDLDDAIKAIKADSTFSGIDISVMGHSWGGFSTLNISALHKDISHVVVLSGFISVEAIISSNFGGLLKGYRPAIMELERDTNPDYVDFDATVSLANYEGKAVLIYSDNDKLVNKCVHFNALYAALHDKENIKLILEVGKGHNPNYTEEAVELLSKYLADINRLQKKGKPMSDEAKAKFRSSYDFDAMTEQDERVWADVFACLDS